MYKGNSEEGAKIQMSAGSVKRLLRNCHKLKELCVYLNSQWSDESFVSVFSASNQLETLFLYSGADTTITTESICSLLSNNRKLKELGFYDENDLNLWDETVIKSHVVANGLSTELILG
jgi:hypothetical protein